MSRLPLVILGGSDRAPSTLPPSGAGRHPLAGVKGAELRLAGRPLIAWIVDRFAACPEFGEVSIAGPADLYRDLVPEAHLIDTDGHLGENLQAAISDLAQRGHVGPFAIASCDVLPEAVDLERALASWRADPSAAVWFPLVRLSDERPASGPFAWKPTYTLRERGGGPVQVWPGHLGIVDPGALRVPFLLRLLDAAYRTRNLPVRSRQVRMSGYLLGMLLARDLRRLVTFRAPTRTWHALRGGLRVARGVRAGTLTVAELERTVASLVLHDDDRKRLGARAVRTVVVDALSLAEDVDTEEEVAQLARRVDAARLHDAPPSSEETASEEAGTLRRSVGRYLLVECIGRGAMAEVWRATDPNLRRDVAVKILSDKVMGEPDTLRRFERETRAVASLSHPNVVAIHDVGLEGGRAFAVTELLQGETLRERMRRGPIPPEEVQRIVAGVASGLAAVHAKDIVHRDVKPENVFLTRAGGIKVLDFGLVRRSSRPPGEGSSLQTTLGTLLGTPDYMSPEQVRGEVLDGRSDLFSLGAVAHEMLTGVRLFSRETPADTLAAILLTDPALPKPPRGKLPRCLRDAVRECLVKDPQGRLRSAGELAERLAGPGPGAETRRQEPPEESPGRGGEAPEQG